MRLAKKILKWSVIGLGTLFTAAFILIHQFTLYPTEKRLAKQFKDKGFEAPALKLSPTSEGIITLIDNERQSSLPTIVFIHGSPGSSQDFRLYFQDSSLVHYRLVSINRIGFAKENYQNIVLDLNKQARAYVEVIDQLEPKVDSVIWVGHSYGGAPAAISTLLSEKSSGLVLAAAPISPKDEPKFWFNRVADNRLIYQLLPPLLKMAQKEKMSHADELQKVEEQFSSITQPIVLLQGDEDFMSPMKNVDYAEKTFTNSDSLLTKRITGQSHFFPFQGREHVVSAIKSFTP